MEKIAVYPVSRSYVHKVTPSIKSLMMNSDVDGIILLTEMDSFEEYLPESVRLINVANQKFFPCDGLNIIKSNHAYLCMMRVVLADLLTEHSRVLSLDADTIVAREIGSELWDLDLHGCHYAGVPEPSISQRLGKPYANMGVAMFDLDRIREDNLAKTMLFALNNYNHHFLEQDCINENLKLFPISSDYNACQFTEPSENPKILHFAYTAGWEQLDPVRQYDLMSWNVVEDKWRARQGL